jgi:hypothetical protein
MIWLFFIKSSVDTLSRNRTYNAGENKQKKKKKKKLKGANSTQKAFCGPKHGNFNAVDKKVMEFVLEKRKNGLPITRETIRLKALENATSLKIPHQDFKDSNGWAIRFMYRKG